MQNQWTTVITPHSRRFGLQAREVWNYRDLVVLLVKRNLLAQYKQTILGPVWFVVQPLLMTLVFTIVFGRIARIPVGGIPHFIFYLAGLTCWSYVSACITETADIFSENRGIFSKVYFPRLVMPIAAVITNVFRFLVQFVFFIAFLAFFMATGSSVKVTIWVLIVPVLLLQMALVSIGVGSLLSAMLTRYRDLKQLIAFGIQLWMYLSPLVYPLSEVPPGLAPYARINPITPILENFRAAFLGTPPVDPVLWLASLAGSVLIFLLGLFAFNRAEKTSMDTV